MIVAAVLVFLALPFVVFRGATLRKYLALELAGYFILGALVLIGAHLRIPPPDPWLAGVAFFVLKLALFSLFLANAREVRWSANRAALLAALVYALVAPVMLRVPIDGDEPYYLLVTESMVRDHDLDLANQYRDLAHSATGRTDLKPQLGDRVGPHGEQYARHEPFLPGLLVPGYWVAGLPGAVATIVLFGILLVRSTVRFFEDEGIDDARIRAVFPFFAFAPPVLYYVARIWPEVPGAFCLVEAVRGIRARRLQRWVPAIFALVMLKLRFALVAAVLILRSRRALLLALLAIPLLVVWRSNVHSLGELVPDDWTWFARGLFGLVLDGMSGIAFQAPFYLLGLFALVRWRRTPEGFRLGCLASVLYVVTLLPRAEWHGGWSPPLRYVVVFMPILALGAAAVWESAKGFVPLIAAWTIGLTIFGLAYPWRLFHIANGENAIGESLSLQYHADFSRLFPSYIRVNHAAIVAAIVLVIALLIAVFARFRVPSSIVNAIAGVLLAVAFIAAQKPGDRIEFEDAHVVHRGGALYPDEYQIGRFVYRGGWIVNPGDSLSFLARGGRSTLHYAAPRPAVIELAGRAYYLPATGTGYGAMQVELPDDGRVLLRDLEGSVNLDRMDHD